MLSFISLNTFLGDVCINANKHNTILSPVFLLLFLWNKQYLSITLTPVGVSPREVVFMLSNAIFLLVMKIQAHFVHFLFIILTFWLSSRNSQEEFVLLFSKQHEDKLVESGWLKIVQWEERPSYSILILQSAWIKHFASEKCFSQSLFRSKHFSACSTVPLVSFNLINHCPLVVYVYYYWVSVAQNSSLPKLWANIK